LEITKLCLIIHEKNDFAEASKILLDTDLKIICWTSKIILLEMMSNAAKNFDILAISLSVKIILIIQQNYSSDLYRAKILDLSSNHSFRVTLN